MISPGLAQESYPIRRSAEIPSWPTQVSPWNDRNRRLVWKHYCKGFHGDKNQTSPSFENWSDYTDPLRVAHEFVIVASAFDSIGGSEISRFHVESAYALLNKRIETVPEREDRLTVCALASVVMARCGVPVHFLADSPEDISYAWQYLLPIYQALDIDVALVSAGDSENERRMAYRSSITFTTTRECAMDFVRDAMNWSGRSDFSQQKVERLLGRRGRHHQLLLRGLYCAIHLDIDSALIDNARTPIVITKDAHPMHETDEIKRSFELAEQLETGVHFTLTGGGEEIQFTSQGEEQIVSWGNEIGGIWAGNRIGKVILKVALIVQRILKEGEHFAIDRKDVRWLIPTRLVPGQGIYGEEFIRKVILLSMNVESNSQKEIIARASYQQIFSHYIHNCGCCHSVANHASEFQSIYGLPVFNRWGRRKQAKVQRTHFLNDQDAETEFVCSWIENSLSNTLDVVVFSDSGRIIEIEEKLEKIKRSCLVLGESQTGGEGSTFSLEYPTIAEAAQLDHIPNSDLQKLGFPIRLLLVGRAVSRTKDNRFLNAINRIQRESGNTMHVTHIVAADSPLFKDQSLGFTKMVYRIFGVKFGGWVLHQNITRVQLQKGKELAKIRRDLLAYDTGMQGLLSFSGRGLYE
ncbi:MAG: hypothetical protein KTR18_04845 [Acidiferrobacterales bacterium]|nr:hypothetical protein [Acidiferrobacterales bacterium]